MEVSTKEKPRNLWKNVYAAKYQYHVTRSSIGSASESEKTDVQTVYMEDLEKRKEVYGVCGECNEPGTGEKWCLTCNAKRFEQNFKNWTSGNVDIDKFIQDSQLNALHYFKCLEWVPYENFQDVTYIAKGGFGKIYSAKWPEGYILNWDIENQKWEREKNAKVALKSLDGSTGITADFLNEIKSHLQIYVFDVVSCYGVTQNPDTKDYMMVLKFYDDGNLRSYLNKYKSYLSCNVKITKLSLIARGLLDIHNAGKVHKDFHSGNILFNIEPYISDLGMCQPVNNKSQAIRQEGVFGVLPYMAPEVLCGRQYTKAADIYSFGIIMNEFFSEEIPYSDRPHDVTLSIKICRGLRPKISEDTPKLIADLIIRCWDAKPENRPTANELYQMLKKWNSECDSSDGEYDNNSEIYSQIKECEKIRENKLKNKSDKDKPQTQPQTHSQAVYTSRLLNFKDLPEPVNSSDLSDSTISDFFDCQIDESDIKEVDPESE